MLNIDQEFLEQHGNNTKTLAKRLHDLKETEIVVDGMLADIARGYRFDDKFAAAKLKMIATVFSDLKPELNVLKTIYQSLLR